MLLLLLSMMASLPPLSVDSSVMEDEGKWSNTDTTMAFALGALTYVDVSQTAFGLRNGSQESSLWLGKHPSASRLYFTDAAILALQITIAANLPPWPRRALMFAFMSIRMYAIGNNTRICGGLRMEI